MESCQRISVTLLTKNSQATWFIQKYRCRKCRRGISRPAALLKLNRCTCNNFRLICNWLIGILYGFCKVNTRLLNDWITSEIYRRQHTDYYVNWMLLPCLSIMSWSDWSVSIFSSIFAQFKYYTTRQRCREEDEENGKSVKLMKRLDAVEWCREVVYVNSSQAKSFWA